MHHSRSTFGTAFLRAACAVPMGLLSIIMSVGCRDAAQSGHTANPMDAAAGTPELTWLDAVAEGDRQRAVDSAVLIVSTPMGPEAPAYVRALFEENGVDPAFLNAPFNQWDARYWEDALFFHRLADRIRATSGGDGLVAAAFDLVVDRLGTSDPADRSILWPRTIWRAGQGLCDRQAWVLSELLYQLGFETQIVYLRDPETGTSPHTICEIRSDTRVWVADPFAEKLMPDTSVADLMRCAELPAQLWPEQPDWQAAVQRPFFFLPVYPQAYCVRNQELYRRLKGALGQELPRFGIPPAERMMEYLRRVPEADRHLEFGFWPYPVRLLRADMQSRQR